MTVNADRLKRDLAAIDISEGKIRPLSAYMQLNDAKTCCKLWMEAVEHCNDPNKLLAMLYLCNDVVQNTLVKKSMAYVTEMARYLEAAFGIALQRAPSQQAQFEKLLKLWTDRAVYSASFMGRVRGAMAAATQGNAGASQAAAPDNVHASEPHHHGHGFDAQPGGGPGMTTASPDLGLGAEDLDSGPVEDADPSLAGLSTMFGSDMGESMYYGGSTSSHPSTSPAPSYGSSAGTGQGSVGPACQSSPGTWGAAPGALPLQQAALVGQQPSDIPPVPSFVDPTAAALASGPLADVTRELRRVQATGLGLKALGTTVRPEWRDAGPGASRWEAEGGLEAVRNNPSRLTVLVEEAGGADTVARMGLAHALIAQARMSAASARLLHVLEETAASLGRDSTEQEGLSSALATWERLMHAQAAGNTVRVERAVPHAAVASGRAGLAAPQALRPGASSPIDAHGYAHEGSLSAQASPGRPSAGQAGSPYLQATSPRGQAAQAVGSAYEPQTFGQEYHPTTEPHEVGMVRRQLKRPRPEEGMAMGVAVGIAGTAGGYGSVPAAPVAPEAPDLDMYEPSAEFGPAAYQPSSMQPASRAVRQGGLSGAGAGSGSALSSAGMGSVPGSSTMDAYSRVKRAREAAASGALPGLELVNLGAMDVPSDNDEDEDDEEQGAGMGYGGAGGRARPTAVSALNTRAGAGAGRAAGQYTNLHQGDSHDGNGGGLSDLEDGPASSSASSSGPKPRFTFDVTGASLGEREGMVWDPVRKEWTAEDKAGAEGPEDWRT